MKPIAIKEVEYTADAIREIWAGDTAETSLVLALLERCEAAESEVERMRAVYEAAVEWHQARGLGSTWEARARLNAAIDTALAAGGKESK